MDQELISKKELLETFGISYGALYRWKRMGLIPEAWFLRRSTSTGQETFFRRDQICQRVRLILDNKEHQTLDELAASLAEKRQTVMARRKLIIETAYGRRELIAHGGAYHAQDQVTDQAAAAAHELAGDPSDKGA